MRLFRRWKLILAGLALLALYGIAARRYPVGTYRDDIRHFVTAESILAGSYRNIASPSAPLITNQLPGYPLLLTIPAAFGSMKLAQWQSAFFTAGAALLIFLIIGGPAGALAAALTALNPLSVMLSGTLMSEPAFLFWTMASLYTAKRFPKAVLPLLLWTAFGAWIRPQGLLLLLVLLPHMPREIPLKKRLIFSLIALGMTGLPFIVNLVLAGTPASYFREIPDNSGLLDTLSGLLSTLLHNARYYFKAPLVLCAEPHIGEYCGKTGIAAAGALWLIIAAGFGKMWNANADASQRLRASYALAFLLAHLFWVNQDPRYFLPILPFLYETAIAGLSLITSRLPLAVFAVFSLSAGIVTDTRILRQALDPAGINTLLKETSAWVGENTGKSDIFMASDNNTAYFLSGRKAAELFYLPDPDDWYRKLLDENISCVWLDNSQQLIDRIPSAKNRLEKVTADISGRVRNKARFRLLFSSPSEKQEIYKTAPPENFTASHDGLLQAKKEINSGRLEQGFIMLKALSEENPPLVRLNFYLGTTAMLLGRKAEALKGLSMAVKLEPEFATAWKNLGRIYEGTGKKKEAGECFSKAENLSKLP